MNKLLTALLVGSLTLGGLTLAKADDDDKGKGEYKGRYCEYGMGRASRIERMAEALGLSESQLKQVREIQEKYHPKKQVLRDKMKSSRQQLREVMQSDNVDQGKVSKLAQQIGDLKAEKIMLRVQKYSEMNKVLTKEQREKMKEMFKNRAKWRHEHHEYGKRYHD